MSAPNTTDPLASLNVDENTQQSISNFLCFILGFSFCAIAFLAQLVNIVFVFRQTSGKSRRIFFYLLLISSILCTVVYIANGTQVLVVYLSGHSQAWMDKLDVLDVSAYPDLDAIKTRYATSGRFMNIAYSLFTLLYIFCVQLRFQSVRALSQYPKWVDYALNSLTFAVWFFTVFLWDVILWNSGSAMGTRLATLWSIYVLAADNVFSGIFLWQLSKALREVRNFSQRRGSISRSIVKSMIGMCATMWSSLILFGLNAFLFQADKDRNLYSVIFCLSFALLPMFFAFGFVWMQAVLQLYASKSSASASRSATAPNPSPALANTLSVNAKKDGWNTLGDEESAGPFTGEGPMVEMRYIPYPAQAAQGR